MSKLIFNPKEDMKKLLDYEFKYDRCKEEYILNVSEFSKGLDGIIIDKNRNVFNYTSSKGKSILIFYKLIKANLIIDEEELNENTKN